MFELLTAALIYGFWPLGGSSTRCKVNTDILSFYKVDWANMLANNCLFTHPAEVEQCQHEKYLFVQELDANSQHKVFVKPFSLHVQQLCSDPNSNTAGSKAKTMS